MKKVLLVITGICCVLTLIYAQDKVSMTPDHPTQLKMKSKAEVETISSATQLTKNQIMQLSGIYSRFYANDNYMTAEQQARLHYIISVVLTEEQLNDYYRNIAMGPAEARTKDQLDKIASLGVYHQNQLMEFKKILIKYNLEMEMIKAKYKYEHNTTALKLLNLSETSPNSVKHILKLAESQQTRTD